MPCGFTTPLSCELRRLGFSLPLHCSALFNHGQVTPFIVYIAAFGRFMRRSRIPKHPCRHIYSRCEVRSCGAGMRPRRRRRVGRGRSPSREAAARARARARTLGVNMLSENAFKEMPTLADKSSDFRFSSGIQVYFWTQRDCFRWRESWSLPNSTADISRGTMWSGMPFVISTFL